MAKVELKLSFPQEARDSAVLLVQQMWTAITLGHVVVGKPNYDEALRSWLSNAAAVLKKCDEA
jgi:hypothetical protein